LEKEVFRLRKMKLSVVIIAKNAEKQIGEAIKSCSFADEVIIIDNNSQDQTPKVAEKLDAKVYAVESDNFSELRNIGIEKSNGEWILYIDSDERVTKELSSKIISQIQKETFFSAYRLNRKNFYFGNYEWPYIERLERLFKKNNLKNWYGQLHESPIVDGPIGELHGFLLHYTHQDLESMLNKTIEWSKIEAELRFKSDHPKMTWWRFPRVMIKAFINSYITQGGWKAGATGIVEGTYQAFSIFITYARLWELQEKVMKKNEI